MAKDGSFTVRKGEYRIKVDGLWRILKALETIGAPTLEMRDLMHEIGEVVARDARRRAPATFAATIRSGHGKRKAVIRAGRKAVPWVGVYEYTTDPKRAPRPNRFHVSGYRPGKHDGGPLRLALQATQPEVFDTLTNGIMKLVQSAGLAPE